MSTSPMPTDSELGILRILWERGPATVRQVYESLAQERDLGYTTVLKTMQMMLDKGQLARDDSERSHVYRAAIPEADTKGQLVEAFMAKAFSGSAQQLVLHALRGGRTSAGELDAIQRLLDEARKGRS